MRAFHLVAVLSLLLATRPALAGSDTPPLEARAAAAAARTSELRAWTAAPGLEQQLDWSLLQRKLAWQPRLATPADARIALCRLSRQLPAWDESEAAALLGRCLQDPDRAVREAAAWALDRTNWSGIALQPLRAALADDAPPVRAAAAAILCRHDDRQGLAPLLAGAAGTNAEAQALCAGALRTLIVNEDGHPPRLRFSNHTPAEVAALVSLLSLKDGNARATAATVLGMIGDSSAGAPILAALGRETSERTRPRLAAALAQLRYRPAAAPLVALLRERDPKLISGSSRQNDFAWGVAGAWAQIGDPDSVPAMIALLAETNTARYAAAALSWAFGLPGADQDYVRGPGPGEILVPTLKTAGKLERQAVASAPSGPELQKLWEAYWQANGSKYPWSDRNSTLRYVILPKPYTWPPVPLPGTQIRGVPAGKKGAWVEIPVTLDGERCNINGVAVDGANGDLYLVPMLDALYKTGCGRGVWKSTDGGATFEKTGEDDTGGGAGSWSSMNMDPAGNGRLAVFSMYGAVAMTLDGGASWRRLRSISEATTDWGDVDWSDPDARTVMQTNHERSPGMHVSSDSGQTWQPVVPEVSYKDGLGVFDANALLHVTASAIRRSEDLGKTWGTVFTGKLRTIVLRKYKGVGYLVGEQALLVSTDKGKTWSMQGTLPDDTRISAGPYFGRDENQIFLVGRKGIHESTDAGRTWKALPFPEAYLDSKRNIASPTGAFVDNAILGYDPRHDVFYVSVCGSPLFYRYER
jgi:photosystem II stability/assembly factor-like uncharacterized protein